MASKPECSACGAGNRAGRQFCAQCGARLPVPCSSCGFANEAGEKFCGGCGISLAAAADARAAQPTPARAGAIITAVGDGERRPVTVLFADLVDYTRMSRALDPEDVHALLERYYATADEIVERFGGSIDKHIGDSVMALFGAPIAHGDDAVVINSFSKYFSMTGWRIGWMVVPHDLMRPIERLAQNLYISPPAIAQAAALGAFDAGEELEANRTAYAANRALLLEELPKAGFSNFAPPDGAFYLYCDVSDITDDAGALAGTLLAEAGVAITPGIDFDAERGNRFLRFSYAGTNADMAEASRRLIAWAQRRR